MAVGTDYFIHPTAVADEGCQIGAGTRVWHFCHVMAGSRIGADCVLGQNVYVDRDVEIGDGCKIQNNVSVYKGVVLEDRVFCGPSVVFTNVINPRAFIERKDEFRTTIIRQGATLGANATHQCGNGAPICSVCIQDSCRSFSRSVCRSARTPSQERGDG